MCTVFFTQAVLKTPNLPACFSFLSLFALNVEPNKILEAERANLEQWWGDYCSSFL